MIADYFRLALKNLSHRGVRTWLTMLGIFVGIAAVVSLISLGQGLQNYINGEFEKIGVNRIIISAGGGGAVLGASGLASAKLEDNDLSTVLNVRGVDSGIGMLRRTDHIEFKDEKEQAFIFGADFSKESVDYMNTIDYMIIEEGRYPSNSEKYCIVIGYAVANDMFDEKINKGDKIKLKDIDFEVVGINKKAGNPGHDNKIVLQIDTMRDIYDAKDELTMLTVRVDESLNISKVADDVKRRLRRARNVKEGEEDFSIETAQQILDNFNNILGVIQVVLAGIAAISLVVGGLGIMTTMYTSVLERTRQIGIMKAIGARNSNILMLFLTEAGLLGAAGGIIGVAMGLAISFGTAYVAQNYFDIELLNASADPTLIVGALSFAFIVGCLSGTLPSLKAAKMKPVDAIRYR